MWAPGGSGPSRDGTWVWEGEDFLEVASELWLRSCHRACRAFRHRTKRVSRPTPWKAGSRSRSSQGSCDTGSATWLLAVERPATGWGRAPEGQDESAQCRTWAADPAPGQMPELHLTTQVLSLLPGPGSACGKASAGVPRTTGRARASGLQALSFHLSGSVATLTCQSSHVAGGPAVGCSSLHTQVSWQWSAGGFITLVCPRGAQWSEQGGGSVACHLGAWPVSADVEPKVRAGEDTGMPEGIIPGTWAGTGQSRPDASVILPSAVQVGWFSPTRDEALSRPVHPAVPSQGPLLLPPAAVHQEESPPSFSSVHPLKASCEVLAWTWLLSLPEPEPAEVKAQCEELTVATASAHQSPQPGPATSVPCGRYLWHGSPHHREPHVGPPEKAAYLGGGKGPSHWGGLQAAGLVHSLLPAAALDAPQWTDLASGSLNGGLQWRPGLTWSVQACPAAQPSQALSSGVSSGALSSGLWPWADSEERGEEAWEAPRSRLADVGTSLDQGSPDRGKLDSSPAMLCFGHAPGFPGPAISSVAPLDPPTSPNLGKRRKLWSRHLTRGWATVGSSGMTSVSVTLEDGHLAVQSSLRPPVKAASLQESGPGWGLGTLCLLWRGLSAPPAAPAHRQALPLQRTEPVHLVRPVQTNPQAPLLPWLCGVRNSPPAHRCPGPDTEQESRCHQVSRACSSHSRDLYPAATSLAQAPPGLGPCRHASGLLSSLLCRGLRPPPSAWQVGLGPPGHRVEWQDCPCGSGASCCAHHRPPTHLLVATVHMGGSCLQGGTWGCCTGTQNRHSPEEPLSFPGPCPVLCTSGLCCFLASDGAVESCGLRPPGVPLYAALVATTRVSFGGVLVGFLGHVLAGSSVFAVSGPGRFPRIGSRLSPGFTPREPLEPSHCEEWGEDPLPLPRPGSQRWALSRGAGTSGGSQSSEHSTSHSHVGSVPKLTHRLHRSFILIRA
ncbi:Hypothetical predicted protein [Marmota monax]|uniref:Uncharacterized protein n=1 Tax=Marmota monax TaxID=9995 RepID=A0A5E4C761_MARMO|nr:Hypothetical predicted protein [Marmota monax]